MPYGYYGRILRVNLSDGALSEDEHDESWYRRYMGGAGISSYYLLRELGPGVDPLGPDNRLIVAPSVMTGAPFSGNARNGVGAKAPMSGGIGKSEVGGFFGAELKHSGYDGIVIEGKADEPVYLWIRDGKAELRDARRLRGMSVLETQETIQKELGERLARTAVIGPAGERTVRFASIINDLKASAGRGGMGAVMGSKNLKAIAVRGKVPPEYADPATIKALAKAMAEAAPTKAYSVHAYGTGIGMATNNQFGNLPTRNFRDGWFENIEPITAIAIGETIRVGMEACWACAVRCKKVVKVDSPWVADPRYGGPEYETLAAFGCNCGIDDARALARAHHLCNQYGMDTISAGATIAFAMESFERGYLSKADLDGVEPIWGSAEAMVKLVEMIGERRGIGDILAEGSKRAAERIGNGAEQLAMQVKGVELGMHEPRLKMGLGLAYAVANHGADHGTGLHDTLLEKAGANFTRDAMPLGILEPILANELSARKANLFAQLHRWQLATDSLCTCNFVPWTYDEVVKLLNAVTGWNTSLAELLTVGERAITMGRVFNLREGFTAADDRLPSRFFSPPAKGYLADQNQAINQARVAEATESYYYFMGWDPSTGVPTRQTLERLELGWLANEMADLGNSR